jgi:hypothetical protein
MTHNQIKEILDRLSTLNEYILALPDDMLLSIDPRDNESLESGLRFIQAYNENAAQFSAAAAAIEEQLKQFFGISPEDEEVEREITNNARSSRIIKELNKTAPHTLDESFTYKRPYGFVLGQAAYKGIKTWRNLYVQVLKELKQHQPQRFANLLDEEKFISSRGKSWFSRTGKDLRDPVRLEPNFYAEGNLSANNIRDNIRVLLEHFGIAYQEMAVYLREDRDAATTAS